VQWVLLRNQRELSTYVESLQVVKKIGIYSLDLFNKPAPNFMHHGIIFTPEEAPLISK